MFTRLADATYRHRRALIVAASVLFSVSVVAASDVFDAASPFDIRDDSTEAEIAREIYGESRGTRPDPEIVVLAGPGTDVQEVRTRLLGVDGVAAVEPAARRRGSTVLLAYLGSEVEFPSLVGGRAVTALSDLRGAEVGGQAVVAHAVEARSEHDLRRIETLAAPVLLLLSLLIFRRPAAAALPLALGAISIVLTLAALRVLAELIQIDLFSLTMATALGTGLAIDYSLFVVARFREEIEARGEVPAALRGTLATAGHTVAFSSLTVALSLAVLIVFPQPFLRSTGIAGGLVALLSGLAAITVLPAALALLGRRVARRNDGGGHRSGRWRQIADRAVLRPRLLLISSLLALTAIAVPGLDLRLTIPDAHILPRTEPALEAAESVEAAFPTLPRTYLTAIVGPESSTSPGEIAAAAEPDGRIARVGGADDGARIVTVTSEADPLSDSATELVRRLRTAGDGEQVITGRPADLIDQRDAVADRLGPAVALLVVATILIVAVMTGSIVLPFVSLLMNLLTIAATIGLLVAIFQDGALESLLGFTAPGAIDISVPIIAMAVVFGLSTDYGMFLLSRIREARTPGRPEAEAIATGMAATGQVVTAAALLFSVAAGAFVFSDLVIVKEVSVAMAAAVILDATIVRIFLLPAVLGILGSNAWHPPPGVGSKRRR